MAVSLSACSGNETVNNANEPDAVTSATTRNNFDDMVTILGQ